MKLLSGVEGSSASDLRMHVAHYGAVMPGAWVFLYPGLDTYGRELTDALLSAG